jgi:hypothetical protein
MFDPCRSALFSLSVKKSDYRSAPKSTFDSRMLSPTQSCWQFLRCSAIQATLENATALPDFFHVPTLRIALKSENQASQKNTDDHSETASTEPDSIELTEHGGLDNMHDTLPLLTL